jgi:hypothetical protein
MPEKGWERGGGSRVDIPASECALQLSTGCPDRVKDKRGHRQGRLTVQEFVGFQISRNGQYRSIWLCVCDCGNYITAHAGTSKTLSRSCGCLFRDYVTECLLDHGGTSNEASPAKRKAYLAWRNQMQNCYSPTAVEYPTIGARGIRICDRWLNNFPQFLEDVGLPPTLGHSLSRLDFDKNYEPSNVRWFTDKERRKRIGNYGKLLRDRIPKPEMQYKNELISLLSRTPRQT